jgi:hypothetical protein
MDKIDLTKILLKHTFDSTSETLKSDTLKAMRDAVEQALKIAAEDATLLDDGSDIGVSEYYICKDDTYHLDSTISVNKQSILDIIKQIKIE